ncbi:peptide ABC transporter substrate-binding protein [Parasulfuritortus cantonensis]|uniref:Peptide ABC transporter substrate-binding protein n=1 Tax=Parasulfuritortus cantonensis TaxID=2528202 RepID=A0A4R1B961_9PROT|nr:ABC transporter substrate-binding protein [Parasulfuritortus cantonensis]TCJ13189.1 peptide ABC transporter substrate-binding protein [Parasulfuritortus cantonensis]
MRPVFFCLLVFVLSACSGPMNDPYPKSEDGKAILYSAFDEPPKHLDPARSYASNEVVYLAQIYEPPLQYHYFKRPYELIPLTASALPRPVYVDADGRPLGADAPAERIAESVYEIHIRPGIYFQPHAAFAGKRELTAADYVYEVKRLAHPGLHSPIFGLMSDYIVGLRELGTELERAAKTSRGWLDMRRYPLAGAQVVDRYTYRIRVKGKYPQFVYWLAMAFFAPMPWEVDAWASRPEAVADNRTLDTWPVGTGPYMMTEHRYNRRIRLARNPNFRGEAYPDAGAAGDAAAGLLADAGKTMPFIDEAVYTKESESIPYWNKFLQGWYDSSGIGSDNFDQAVRVGAGGESELTPAMRAKGIALKTSVATTSFYTGFNMLDPVVGGLDERHRKLRQALAIAVDIEEYIAIFANGRGIPAQGPLPPGLFGYRDGAAGINPVVYDWVAGKPRRKPIAEARRLLAEAGYPDGRDAATGKPLVLNLDTMARGPDDKARLDWLRKQFRKLDIELVVRGTDYNRFQDKMREGTEQIFEWGWNADYPDPENFLFLLYGPNRKVGAGGENATNYVNPEFDRLFVQMKDMDNGPARQAVIDRMVAMLRQDSPWLFGFHPKDYVLHHAWLKNVKPNQMANNGLKYRRIDVAARATARKAWNRPHWAGPVLAVLVLAVALVPAWLAYRKRQEARAR